MFTTGTPGMRSDEELAAGLSFFRRLCAWGIVLLLLLIFAVLLGWLIVAEVLAVLALLAGAITAFIRWRRPILSREDEELTNREFREAVNPTNFPFGGGSRR
ncbi:MAG: hypothetical protein RL681_378 [Candidatus Parcubacteria bacterium]|jgi:hypothetical protein